MKEKVCKAAPIASYQVEMMWCVADRDDAASSRSAFVVHCAGSVPGGVLQLVVVLGPSLREGPVNPGAA